jgi:glc operon protein GlcG
MKKLIGITMMLAAALVAPAQLATKKALTLEAAKQIAAAAQVEARKNNWTMVICVVDDGGNLIYLEKMDGTQNGSIQVAQDKATTAVNFKRPTKALEDAVAGGRNAVLKLTGAIPIEGGIPIMVGTELVGGIGVSGGTSPQDAQVATAGLKVVEKMK